MIVKTRPLLENFGDANRNGYNAITGVLFPPMSQFTEERCLRDYNTAKKTIYNYASNFPWNLVNSERIEYTNNKSSWNNCDHTKVVWQSLPYLYYQYGSVRSRVYFVHYWKENPYVCTQKDIPNVYRLLYTPVSVDQGFMARSYWSMKPQFEGDFQLLNFLFELKDFRDFVKLLQLSKTQKLLDKIQYVNRKHRGVPPSNPVQAGATGVLLWNLCIQPTMRDLANLRASLMHQAKDKFGAFIFEGTRLNTAHYTEGWINHTNKLTNGPLTVNGVNYIFATGSAMSYKDTASIQYKYVPRGEWPNAKIFADYWGVSGTAEQFWNMIPMSFVLDYFLTVGKSIKLMSRGSGLDVTDYQYCISRKILAGYGKFFGTDTRDSVIVVNGKWYGPKRPPIPYNGLIGNRYVRQLREPYKGPALPKLKMPNQKQLLNIAALMKCILF